MKFLSLFLFLFLSLAGNCQPLFSYGSKSVSSHEFLAAFRKSGGDKPSSAAYREYLELFSRYKLKVQAALDIRLDTMDVQRKELADYKKQLIESFTGADSVYQQLAHTEFERAQKDVLLGMILIPVPYGSTTDSVRVAEKTIRLAYAALKKAEPFEKVALRYSGDPSVKTNKGMVGYVTAFVLPYQVETVLYNTPNGEYSAPFFTRSGWVIVQHAAERPAVGQVVVSQILIGYPQEDGMEGKLRASQLSDSLFNLLKAGAEFGELSKNFSHDLFSYQEGGRLPAFGPGTYASIFEEQAFALSKPGELSPPFETSNGFHLLKLEKRIPPYNQFDSAARDAILQQLQQSDRADYIESQVLARLKTMMRFKQASIDHSKLLRYTALMTENPRAGTSLFKNTDVLFTVNNKPYTIQAFNRFIKEKLSMQDATGDLYAGFIMQSAKEQYGQWLDKTNPAFRQQLHEFSEANLLFMMMQRKVWTAATDDLQGLQKFYQRNALKYKWENSADAVIFSATNDSIAESFKNKLGHDPSSWRQLVNDTPGIQGDSGRYELSQIPVAERTNFSEKLITSNQHVENEPTVNFAYIIRLYPAGEQKGFEDTRGQVISDYQDELEEKWIADIKKKYPVKINEAAMAALPLK